MHSSRSAISEIKTIIDLGIAVQIHSKLLIDLFKIDLLLVVKKLWTQQQGYDSNSHCKP